ncbi:hypothetical protein D3C80_1760320 [compost metagenome]
MAHHAETGVKTLFGIGVAGGDGRYLGDTGVVIHPRCGNAGAGIPVADYARDAAIDQTLSNSHRGARIGLVIFGLQFKGHGFAADGWMLFVDIVNRQLRAVLQIFADTCRRAGERACKADDHGFAFRRP